VNEIKVTSNSTIPLDTNTETPTVLLKPKQEASKSENVVNNDQSRNSSINLQSPVRSSLSGQPITGSDTQKIFQAFEPSMKLITAELKTGGSNSKLKTDGLLLATDLVKAFNPIAEGFAKPASTNLEEQIVQTAKNVASLEHRIVPLAHKAIGVDIQFLFDLLNLNLRENSMNSARQNAESIQTERQTKFENKLAEEEKAEAAASKSKPLGILAFVLAAIAIVATVVLAVATLGASLVITGPILGMICVTCATIAPTVLTAATVAGAAVGIGVGALIYESKSSGSEALMLKAGINENDSLLEMLQKLIQYFLDKSKSSFSVSSSVVSSNAETMEQIIGRIPTSNQS
jgi:hypothetical protein